MTIAVVFRGVAIEKEFITYRCDGFELSENVIRAFVSL